MIDQMVALRPALRRHAAILIGKRTHIGSPEDFMQLDRRWEMHARLSTLVELREDTRMAMRICLVARRVLVNNWTVATSITVGTTIR